ncbi:MAG: metalloregulator ArsR/SmtB family transcription factor [Anaerolineae bacterium]|nr:metalloregulator ArsR/SmtB family transcription factor [Anaerolineae bacterium]
MNTQQDYKREALLDFFKAVGQPDRLRILGKLANKPATVPELAEALSMKETAVSRHLRAMQTAGLVARHQVAFTETFTFIQSGLDTLNEIVDGNMVPESLEERVLREYIVNGRLRAIPLKAEERMIILRWMANKFEPGHRYTETEVTELVQQYYDKPLTLRRILADNRFLIHTGRQYWRPLPEHYY